MEQQKKLKSKNKMNLFEKIFLLPFKTIEIKDFNRHQNEQILKDASYANLFKLIVYKHKSLVLILIAFS
jgi:hypothetical protein